MSSFADSHKLVELSLLEAMREDFTYVTVMAAKATEEEQPQRKSKKTKGANRAQADATVKKEDGLWTNSSRTSGDDLNLISLPDVALDNILSFLDYDQVAQMRIVCKRFDKLCKFRLNSGFRAVERYHARCLRNVKSRLPRRESKRRSHPLARHCDILTAVETRISLLAMTFMKFVDVDMCCFIPGKVLDEIFRVLRSLVSDKNPPKAYEVLQELRDISSMAMEHFDDKIVPTLKAPGGTWPGCSLSPRAASKMSPPAAYLGGLQAIFTSSTSLKSPCAAGATTTSTSGSASPSSLPSTTPIKTGVFTDKLRMLERTSKKFNKFKHEFKKQMREQDQAIQDQNVKIANLESLIASQQAIIAGQVEKLKEQDRKISEIWKATTSSEEGQTQQTSSLKRQRSADGDELGEAKRAKVAQK